MTGSLVQLGLIFAFALAVLVKSSDYFVDNAEKISKRFGIPAFVIGVTIVGIGTSLPELITSLIATLQGETEIVAANAIGSNITNIFLILGFSSLFVFKADIKKNLFLIDFPLLFLATTALILMTSLNTFDRVEGIILIIIYVFYTIFMYMMHTNPEKFFDKEQIKKEFPSEKKLNINMTTTVIGLLLGGIGIYFGAKYTIDALIAVSQKLHWNSSVLTLSLVAFGTSLPELSVSYSAVKKNNFSLILGNVIGSNLFNSTLVIGIPALFANLTISQETMAVAIPFLIGASVVLLISLMDNKIFRYEGIIYLLLYFLFIYQLYNLL